MEPFVIFRISGKLGDAIYAMAAVRYWCRINNCKAWVILHEGNATKGQPALPVGYLHPLESLLMCQSWIKRVAYDVSDSVMEDLPFVDLDRWRWEPNVRMTPIPISVFSAGVNQLVKIGMDPGTLSGFRDALTVPWLKTGAMLGPESFIFSPIVINWTGRWPGTFNWSLLKPYNENVLFLGSGDERDEFSFRWGWEPVRWVLPVDLRAAGMVLTKCRLFMGCQSAPYALAEALKISRAVDVSIADPNAGPFPGGYVWGLAGDTMSNVQAYINHYVSDCGDQWRPAQNVGV